MPGPARLAAGLPRKAGNDCRCSWQRAGQTCPHRWRLARFRCAVAAQCGVSANVGRFCQVDGCTVAVVYTVGHKEHASAGGVKRAVLDLSKWAAKFGSTASPMPVPAWVSSALGAHPVMFPFYVPSMCPPPPRYV